MKLDFIEVCGFRGFRDKIRVDFGSGFTVLSGRNGVGKSTYAMLWNSRSQALSTSMRSRRRPTVGFDAPVAIAAETGRLLRHALATASERGAA
jgi:predicted ATP-dependent endonuclease of OLD family